MRVLFVTPYYEPAWKYGGVIRASQDWAIALINAGVEVCVYTTTANGNDELDIPSKRIIDRKGVKVTYFPRSAWSGNRFISLPLFRACTKHIRAFDAVHSIGLWTFPSFISSLIARAHGIPYFVSLHGMLMPWALNHHRLTKRIFFSIFERPRLTRSNQLICCTEMERSKLKELNSNLDARVIPNVVQTGNAAPKTEIFRKRFKLIDAFIILFAGRIVENKGLHLSLEAFARIADRHKDVHFVIAGPDEGNSIVNIKEKIRDLGIQERVCFTGLLTGLDYWEALSNANLFVLNSYSENFGLSPAEALACGIPVLISDQIGIAEYVNTYNCGWVTPLEINAIAGSLNAALSERDLLLKMGKNGIRLIKENFSSSAVGHKFMNLLEEILDTRKN